jgi:hypothetical protein
MVPNYVDTPKMAKWQMKKGRRTNNIAIFVARKENSSIHNEYAIDVKCHCAKRIREEMNVLAVSST